PRTGPMAALSLKAFSGKVESGFPSENAAASMKHFHKEVVPRRRDGTRLRPYDRRRAQRNGEAALSPLEHEREVAGIRIIEQQARAFVEQVGIDVVGFTQRDPPLPDRTLGLDGGKVEGQLRNILVEIPLGDQTVLARIGI